jgi:LAO/AO transport system kinase
VSRAQERAEAIRNGDRRALARAITLVESTRPDHRLEALALLESLMPDTGKAIRLGISGAPGVGKSTFIEALGRQLIAAGHQLAVLAVDPTSARAGGSILGDKTRMQELGRSANAFIRPSPSGRSLGGVARRSREALLLCEAAGFDVVIVETVGVGQAEIAVRDMVDMFVLLVAPAAGDDLQGIKRGIVEIADLLVVNKADGELAATAMRTRADYQNALDLLRPASPHWRVPVLAASALKGSGIAEVWQAVRDHRAAVESAGELAKHRAQQALAWMWSEVTETLAARLRDSPAVAERLPEIEGAVAEGLESPTAAATDLLAAFLAESVKGPKA